MKREDFTDAIDRLADEIRCLRDAIDEFKDVFQWAAQNRPESIERSGRYAGGPLADYEANG